MTLNTRLLLWLDDQPLDRSQEFSGYYQDSPAYEVHVGKDFGGVIRALSIYQDMDWDCTVLEESTERPSNHI